MFDITFGGGRNLLFLAPSPGKAWPTTEAGMTSEQVTAQERVNQMQDAIFIAATLAFFVVAIVYVHGCERLK